jgi:hypothetical protein
MQIVGFLADIVAMDLGPNAAITALYVCSTYYLVLQAWRLCTVGVEIAYLPKSE